VSVTVTESGRGTGGTDFEHVEKGRFAGIVEAEEEQLCVFVEQAKRGKHIPEPTVTASGPCLRRG
jgi:hypothetical protein